MPYAAAMWVLGMAAAYLVGGLPFGLWVCRAWSGYDPRQYGSGNIGATNVYRLLGPMGFVVVLALDAGKGFAAVKLGAALAGGGPWAVLACALSAIVGSNWSVYLGFKGGKGVGVSLGAAAAAMPLVALLSLVTWIVVVAVCRYVSLASIVAACMAGVYAVLLGQPVPYRVFGGLIAVFVLIRHRANIGRLAAGTEPRFGARIKPTEGGECKQTRTGL
jgi:glycerol-3-phosphate acyltransferase PlsY